MKNCRQMVPGEYYVDKAGDVQQSEVEITEENTFIMALDGDVDFYPSSVDR